jgi:hypothetical protein
MEKGIGQTKSEEDLAKQRRDAELDRELEATFPASDALKITRSGSQTRVPDRSAG